jgi:hypothetical protein
VSRALETLGVPWAACVFIAACSGAADDASMEAGSDSAGASLPDACSPDESPFLQPDCLDALRQACNEQDEENVCVATEPFDVSGYRIRCAWAKVVAFSDTSACTVDAVVGRCEASIETPCGDYCTENELLSNVSAIPSRQEIIRLCGGPIGPWSAVGADSDHTSMCADNVVPPADPLCQCAEVACAAQ